MMPTSRGNGRCAETLNRLAVLCNHLSVFLDIFQLANQHSLEIQVETSSTHTQPTMRCFKEHSSKPACQLYLFLSHQSLAHICNDCNDPIMRVKYWSGPAPIYNTQAHTTRSSEHPHMLVLTVNTHQHS